MSKRVLVYPCGTEIGLEVYRAVHKSTHYELVGGSSTYDHGRFVYKQHIDNLPFITDDSGEKEIMEFNDMIKNYHIDIIYPAMDGVITIFSKYRNLLTPLLIAPDYSAAEITRSKSLTYKCLKDKLAVPDVYPDKKSVLKFPVFVKPDVGQGARGTMKIEDRETLTRIDLKGRLLVEYLPGTEYTIDCFTNGDGKLIYARGRSRNRIKNGISVNAIFKDNDEFLRWAEVINGVVRQKGAWFFQVKQDDKGEFKLLEVASRIAGTSALTRCTGVNLPLLSLDVFVGINIDDVIINNYDIELDRALENRYRISLEYEKIYIDYDDTVVANGVINSNVMKFLYQCINKKIKIILLTRHAADLEGQIKKYRMEGLFDSIIQLDRTEKKSKYIDKDKSIFIDDSYGERKEVYEKCRIPVFDVNMIEVLLED